MLGKLTMSYICVLLTMIGFTAGIVASNTDWLTEIGLLLIVVSALVGALVSSLLFK